MDADATSRFHTENAAIYAAQSFEPSKALEPFLARLKPGAEILELGCGNGRDSAAMMARGFRVTPTDGTPEMAREASSRLGIEVRVLSFAEISFVPAFDGIWANACLLHVLRADLGGVLAAIYTALRPGGVFAASFKAGEAEGCDGLGRHYNYPARAWLEWLVGTLPWATVEVEGARGSGYDKVATDWLQVTAIRR